MKKTFVLCLVPTALFFAACSHNPNKAEKIDTDLKSAGTVTGETVGVKDGNMVVQKKTLLTEQLRDLQYEVYGLEDAVYGNEKYGTSGLYGILKQCRLQIVDKRNGGDGKLIWTEPMDRVTDKEDEFKIGIDEHDKLVTVSEEFIVDRINRFKEYKKLLLKRENEYQEKVDICKADLRAKQFDAENKQGTNP